ncbi:MAG: hypothetical protein DRJ68_04020, partial [Thermoprotei archaeon]
MKTSFQLGGENMTFKLREALLNHLSKLKTRVIIDLVFKAGTSSIHVGAPELTIEPLRRLFRVRMGNKDEFIVPSSSIKGAFRSLSEKIAKSMKNLPDLSQVEKLVIELHREDPKKMGLLTHDSDDPRALTMLKELDVGAEEMVALGIPSTEAEEIVSSLSKSKPDDNAKRLMDLAFPLYCPICKLYGAPSLAGKLKFYDCFTMGDHEVHFTHHAGISRSTLVSQEDILYTLEECIALGGLKTTIIADNITPGETDAKLLALTLDAILKLGLHIGARKSVGLGHIS